MKNIYIKYCTWLLCIGAVFASCSPDDIIVGDNSIVDITSVDSIGIAPDYLSVIANGVAVLDLRPQLFRKEKQGDSIRVIQILDARVNDEWIEYSANTSLPVSRYFSTNNQSLVGSEIGITAKIKGTNIYSEEVKIKVVAPVTITREITIPVVFHILQTQEDVENFGYFNYAKIDMIVKKLNNAFGNVAPNAIGIDTKITFKKAVYDHLGNRLHEEGVNRLSPLTSIGTERNKEVAYYDSLLQELKIVWPTDQYMNIWLVTDRTTPDFGSIISERNIPGYYTGSGENVPNGLNLRPYDSSVKFTVFQSGVIYKSQLINAVETSTGNSGTASDNDLLYYVGKYLGLLQTFSFTSNANPDYCDDTHNYSIENNTNTQMYKTANNCYFLSTNIMDDPTGVHTSVSQDQYKRIFWILENSPERSAWKSSFAFTGNK